VLVIHGGSWSGGDNKQLPALNSYLAQQGYHVAAIQYRLAPKYKSPAPVEDTKTALHYLNTHAETLGIDTCNYILLGRSAGAQIALVAAYTFHDFSIKGVISFYGPADMVWGARFKSSKLVLNTEEVFRNYFGDLIDKVPEKYTEASAYAFAEKNSPPTLLIHGPNDPMVSYDHSVRLNKKLEENQVAHYFLNLPWATHGCDYNINGPSGQISTFSIERFITSVTSSSCKHSPS
jgi:acetyl esterase/lipase